MNWRDKPSFGQLTVDGTTTLTGMATASAGIVLPVYTVATLPATPTTNMVVICSNGNAGQETLVYYTGAAWIALATGATAATA